MEKNLEKATCFKPVYTPDSRILILGTMPSVQSVKYGFYYMGYQNYFWRLLTDLSGIDFASEVKAIRRGEGSVKNLIKGLNDLGIALFDTYSECYRIKSGDDDLTQTKLNSRLSIQKIIKNSKIEKIFCTSGLAYENLKKIFGGKDADKVLGELTGSMQPVEKLYSPSSRARASYGQRLKQWEIITKYLKTK